MNQDKPKHTSGPWIIGDARQHRKCYGGTVREEDWRFGLYIRAKDNCHLATVGHVDQRYYAEAKANAQLMGSAPELLAALEKLTALAANQLGQSATHDGLENCKALADARQAIAKAKGGQQ